MYNYLALVWDATNADARRTALELVETARFIGSKWHTTLSTEGLAVFDLRPRDRALCTYLLAGGQGVLLGRIFPQVAFMQDSYGRVLIDDARSAAIAQSGGEYLVEHHWGSYIGIIRAPGGDEVHVMRDCSGALPCYRLRHKQVDIFFSDLNDLARLRIPALALNYQYLAAYIYYPTLHVQDCGVAGVTELLAGQCVSVKKTGLRQHFIWDPRKIALRRTIERFEQAKTELLETTLMCVKTWAEQSDRILLSLSGGLDSAIVLGCLDQLEQGAKLTCFNQFTPNNADSMEDERQYARIAAARASVPLVELPWSDALFDSQVLSLPKAPKVYPGDVYWWLELASRNELATRTGADVIWTGQGGDHLFWSPRQFPVAADYVSRHRFGRLLFGAVRDTARLSNSSYVSVIRDAFALGWTRSPELWLPKEEQAEKGHFVNPDALPEKHTEYVINSWQRSSPELSPVKQAQIYFLSDVLNRHNHIPQRERAYQRHPLLAQPLIELSLQIPIYVHIRGGRRRALARSTFRDLVPAEITNRDDKGQTMLRVKAMIRENEGFLREQLLNGVLVRERIVSRRELELILVEGRPYRPNTYWPLLACITAEVFAQAIEGSRHKIAA